ncbi:Cytochrome C assembly protein [Cyclonatronum proteinivorum]|uniref:Cytochrome C assembly protein n=2 Tax=Cyclonatronum proteinivorum TaxID=1457365 RepID=A0A345UHW8_9BACT|nr:cytochrome c biogenesis protein CcsA [Cyclonatronum proteinivorum]AXJ00070.1 Cytochrome C assembly protein [Cyclonatronum proteinivorum]
MMPIDPTLFTLASIALWAVGMALFLIAGERRTIKLLAHASYLSGVVVLAVFAWLLWDILDRPPMRTLGETRLWYAMFLPVIGYATYMRWNYSWILHYSGAVAIVFVAINLIYPDNYDRDLMPALQSIWFVPHVIVYIFAYALLAASAIVAVKGLAIQYLGLNWKWSIQLADNLVYLGLGFLTLGLLFGALWGKEAWGHYWMWDPQETWAFLTWIGYLGYIHFRYHKPGKTAEANWMLAVAFIILLIAWFGVNYLPSAANSVHTYTQ